MATLSFKVESDVTESLRDMAKLEKTTDKTTEAMKDLGSAIDKTSKETDELTQSTQKQTKSAEAQGTATDGVAKKTRAFNGEAGLLARTITGLGDEARNMARTFAAGLGIAGAIKLMTSATQISTEFGSEIAKVSTALADTSQLARYSTELRGLALEYGLAASAQAASLYEIISAGQDAETALKTLDAANRLAVGGLTSVETAADGLTSIMNAYSGKIRDAAQVSDILFAGAAAGKTNIDQLASSLGQVATTAATVGVPLDELVGTIGTLTLSGVNTSVAVTQVKATLNALIKPSQEASELAKELGLEFSVAAVRSKGFAGFLEEVREKTQGSEEAIGKLFGSTEAIAAVLSLTGGQAQKFAGVLDQTANSAGATAKAYSLMSDTADFAFKRAKTAAQDAMLSLGNDLNSILVPAAKAFADNIEGITAAVSAGLKIAAAYLTIFVALPAAYNLTTTAAWNFVAALQAQNTGLLTGAAQMGALRIAGATVFAAFAGWQIGTTLREQFVEVRLFGIAMVEGVLVGWERIKQGAGIAWEGVKAYAIGSFNVIREILAKVISTFADGVESIDFTGMYSTAIAGARNVAAAVQPATSAYDEMRAAVSRINAEAATNIANVKTITGEMAEYEIQAQVAADAAKALAQSNKDVAITAPPAAKGLDVLGKSAKQTADEIKNATKTVQSILSAQARALGNQYADAALDYAAALDQISEAEAKLKDLGALGAEQIDQLNEARKGALEILKDTTAELDKAAQDESAKKMADDAKELNDILNRTANMGFAPLIREMELVGDAIKDALDRGEDVSQLKAAMGGLKHELAVNMVGAAQQVLGSVQSMTKEGSKAYKAMAVASQALNVVMAISAILNQGKGDPYTSFARMAAMAAAVAGLVGSLGGFGGGGGGGSQSAEAMQQTQGTGTVLGDAEAQSESIANSMQITADATSELVGINRGMLRALTAMQAGITGAVTSIAGTPQTEASLSGGFDLNLPGSGLSLGAAILSSIFGGSQELIDRGIQVGGGSFGSVSANPNASTYQTIETDGGWFHSDDTDVQATALSAEARAQIGMVLTAMGDAVREGARALGMDMEAVNAAIAAYRVAEIRISTMDLSGEEAQAQLEAVFSSIFDGLAGSVVPFIGQFQQLGEGLGETLIRVATGVQVMQEALGRLGFAIDVTDPEEFAQISEGLIGLVGGLDEFISSMATFMDNFAPEAHKFEILQNDLTRAFDEVGLTIPETRDGMWELMQSLDATTESGREQIAALLRLSGVADAYYTHLERNAEEAAEAVEDFSLRTAEFTQSLADAVFEQEASEFQRSMMSIQRSTAGYIRDANNLARARGDEGASTRDLALIHRWAANEVKKAIAQLEGSIAGLVEELGYGEMNTIMAQIAAMEAAQSGATETQLNGIDSVGDAASDLFAQWEQGIISLQQYIDGLLVGELSPLTPEEQFTEAQRQLNEALAGAGRGDIASLNALPQLAEQFLTMLREREASGADYSGPAAALIAQLQALGVNPYSPNAPGGGGGGGSVALVPSEELLALYARRDELAASTEAAQRLALATQLAEYLTELAQVTGETVFAAAARLGVDFAQFITDLGGTVAATTAEQVATLGDVANVLGVELPELADALGLALGELTDTQSLLNDAFEFQLAGMPVGIREQLEPLLRDVENASSPEEQLVALDALNEATNSLPEEFRLALAPYLSAVDPITPELASELDYLSDMWTELTAANALLAQIRDELIVARGGTVPGNVPEGAMPAALEVGAKFGAAASTYDGAVVAELQLLRAALTLAASERKADDERNTQRLADATANAGDKVSNTVDSLKSGSSVSYYGSR